MVCVPLSDLACHIMGKVTNTQLITRCVNWLSLLPYGVSIPHPKPLSQLHDNMVSHPAVYELLLNSDHAPFLCGKWKQESAICHLMGKKKGEKKEVWIRCWQGPGGTGGIRSLDREHGENIQQGMHTKPVEQVGVGPIIVSPRSCERTESSV